MGSTCLCNCGDDQGSGSGIDTGDKVTVVAFMSIYLEHISDDDYNDCNPFSADYIQSRLSAAVIPPVLPAVYPYCLDYKGDRNKIIANWNNCETDIPFIRMIKVFINGKLEVVDDLTYIFKNPVPLKTMNGYYSRGGFNIANYNIIDPETKNSIIGFLPGVQDDFAKVEIYNKDRSKLKKIKFEIVLNNNKTYYTFGNVVKLNCQADTDTVAAHKTDLTIEPSFEADMEKILKDNPSISVFYYPIIITPSTPNIPVKKINVNSKYKFKKNCRIIDSYVDNGFGGPPTIPCDNNVKTAGGDNFINTILDNYSYTSEIDFNYILIEYYSFLCNASYSNDYKTIKKSPPPPILTGGRTYIYINEYFPYDSISVYRPFVGLRQSALIGQNSSLDIDLRLMFPPYICAYSENYEDKKKKFKTPSFGIDCKSIKNNKITVNCENPFIDRSKFGHLIDPEIKYQPLLNECFNFTDYPDTTPLGSIFEDFTSNDFVFDALHWIFTVRGGGPKSEPVIEESCNYFKITQQYIIYLYLEFVWSEGGGTDTSGYGYKSDTGSCVDYRPWAYIIESTVEASYESN